MNLSLLNNLLRGFTSYINNGELSVNDSEILKKAEVLLIFLSKCSEKELMIVDMQGSEYHLSP